MGLLGNSKWGPGTSDASTPEREAPKASGSDGVPGAKNESVSGSPQSNRFSEASKNQNNKRNNNSRKLMADRITRENSQPYSPAKPNPPMRPRDDRRPPPNQPAGGGHLGNGIDHGYGNSAQTVVGRNISQPLSGSSYGRSSQPHASQQLPAPMSPRNDTYSVPHKHEVGGRQGDDIDHGYDSANTPAQRDITHPTAKPLTRGPIVQPPNESRSHAMPSNPSVGPILGMERASLGPDSTAPNAGLPDVEPTVPPAPAINRLAKKSTVKKVVSFATPPKAGAIEALASTTTTATVPTPPTTSTPPPPAKPEVLHATSALAPTPSDGSSTTSTLPETSKIATYRIPPQNTLSDTDFHFLLAKLQGREISAKEWDVAVQQVHSFDFGKPFSAQTQTASETAPQMHKSRAQKPEPDPAAHGANVHGSVKTGHHVAKPILSASPRNTHDTVEQDALGVKILDQTVLDAVDAVRTGREEEHVVAEQKREASPDVWRQIKQKLDMADDVKEPVQRTKHILVDQNEDEEEW